VIFRSLLVSGVKHTALLMVVQKPLCPAQGLDFVVFFYDFFKTETSHVD
jgi:hypothetical protein